MCSLLVQGVVVGVLRSAQAVVTQIRLEVLHFSERRVECRGGVTQPVQRGGAQVVDLVLMASLSRHFKQRSIKDLLKQQA